MYNKNLSNASVFMSTLQVTVSTNFLNNGDIQQKHKQGANGSLQMERMG